MANASAAPTPSTTPASGTSVPAQLDHIARAAVRLAALGPRLARLAGEMETQAQAQARRAAEVATTIERLTGDLHAAVKSLRTSAADVEAALASVTRIADFTRILAVNASIEAARAGVHGRAFGVVVEEVQQLAQRTRQTTDTIDGRVQEMRSSIAGVEAVAGDGKSGGVEAADTRSVGAVNRQAGGMAQSAAQQLEGVKTLNKLGDDVNALTESLLLGVGAFRFEAHARAEGHVALLVEELDATPAERHRLERVLRLWLEKHPHFELVYLTDADGRQIVDNIALKSGRIALDRGGFGRDWSERPWFLDTVRRGGAGSTDIYRSAATGDFCFTIAAPVRDEAGAIRGVLGADVNFQRLLEL